MATEATMPQWPFFIPFRFHAFHTLSLQKAPHKENLTFLALICVNKNHFPFAHTSFILGYFLNLQCFCEP